MCGINVAYSFSSIKETDRASIDLMNQEMRYRGPDDHGIWSDEIACLGAVRLAIIGLGNGHQPILNESEDVVLVCNGEIYNYRELKDSLVEKGHRFNTDTDIEVMVHLYEDHGRDFVSQINGMFAFAIYDRKKRSLLIGRDRLGEKPLYYSQQFGAFLVSSELKTIAIYGTQDITADCSVVAEASYSPFPQDPERTLFNEIKRVLPGECISITQKKVERFRYWNGRRQIKSVSTEEDSAIEIRRLLERAVKRTLIADVPIAVMLSGGIDSSVIAAIASQHSSSIEAISIGYEDDSAQDERPIARQFAKDLGIKLHEIELTKQDFLSAFEEYTQILDEPIWDPASIMQWHIFKRARELGFKVLLSGQGSDEFFFGYPRHVTAARHFSLLSRVSNYLPLGRLGLKIFLKDLLTSPREMCTLLRTTGYGEWNVPAAKSPKATAGFSNPKSVFWSYQHGGSDAIECRFTYLQEIYLSANGFLQADKLSMAHSVEVRCPFADADLINFVLSLPVSYLIKASENKYLLKKAIRNLIPQYIADAPKKGFQPSDSCLVALTKHFQIDHDDWTAMTSLVTDLIINKISSDRIEYHSR